MCVLNWFILGGFFIFFVYLYVKELSFIGVMVNMVMIVFFIGVCFSFFGYFFGRFGVVDVKYLVVLGLVSDLFMVFYSLVFGCLLCIVLFIFVKLFKCLVEKFVMNEEVCFWRVLLKNKLFFFIFVMSVGFLVYLIISKIIWVNLWKILFSDYMFMVNIIWYGCILMYVFC